VLEKDVTFLLQRFMWTTGLEVQTILAPLIAKGPSQWILLCRVMPL